MIVAVLAEKGGVGKTIIATNLAGMRAHGDGRVLLVNGDRQGSADLWARYREDTDLPGGGVRLSVRCVSWAVPPDPRGQVHRRGNRSWSQGRCGDV